MSESDEKKADRLKRLLSTPFLDDFPENVLKIRRNLIAYSSLSLIIVLSDLKIEDGRFLGLNVEGLNTELITTVLFYTCIYNLVHFLFQSADYVDKWRLRVTACAESDRPVRGDYNEDYSYNPSQSTLYNWWEGMIYQLENRGSSIVEAKEACETLIQKIDALKDELEKRPSKRPTNTETDLRNKIVGLRNNIISYGQHIREIQKVVESDRLRLSLKNFDRWFWSYQWFTLSRVLIIEFLLPVILGVTAIILTSPFNWVFNSIILAVCGLSLGILPWLFKRFSLRRL